MESRRISRMLALPLVAFRERGACPTRQIRFCFGDGSPNHRRPRAALGIQPHPSPCRSSYTARTRTGHMNQETDCLCSLPDIDCPWADRMFRFASATVFVFSFATKGLLSEVDRSESCLDTARSGLRLAHAGEFIETLPQGRAGPGFTAWRCDPVSPWVSAPTVALRYQ
jgi:hypothetical protein